MEVITRKQALARGLKTYFIGKPCKYGHVAERYTVGSHCRDCNRARHVSPDQLERHRAREQGLKRYFTGEPCKHGHVAERNTAIGACCECQRASCLFENMTPERIKRALAHSRAANLTPEELERRRERGRAANMTPEQLERRRAYHRYETMTPKSLERRRAHGHRRRAQKLGSGGELSLNIHATLWAKQCGQCVYCRVDLTTVKPHLDHRMPLILGGTNTDDNVQLLCPFCNCSKGATDPDEYEARIGFVRAA